VDSQRGVADVVSPHPTLAQTYAALDALKDILIPAQANGSTRALVLHANSPRPTETVAIGGYLMQATLSRSFPDKTLLAEDGAMLIMQSAPSEFYIAGSGLTVTFSRDPDCDDRITGIASIEEVSHVHDQWITLRRLNGDQSNQGRQLSMAPNQVHIYRVVLYTAERTPVH